MGRGRLGAQHEVLCLCGAQDVHEHLAFPPREKLPLSQLLADATQPIGFLLALEREEANPRIRGLCTRPGSLALVHLRAGAQVGQVELLLSPALLLGLELPMRVPGGLALHHLVNFVRTDHAMILQVLISGADVSPPRSHLHLG
eukprot:scaffold1299_cov246-Pinguiococcus_pyrenoidosus.AAC.7